MKEAFVSQMQYFCTHDGPGIRTTLFFMGCPLQCSWCHNPECSRYAEACKKPDSPIPGIKLTIDTVYEAVKADHAFYGHRGGVTCSGGEPLLEAEFIRELWERCHIDGISTALETCLFASKEELSTLLTLTDLWIVDLKCINPEKHLKYTGQSNLLILENFRWLLEHATNIWVRMPIIPNAQDEADIEGLVKLLAGESAVKNVELIPFHQLGREKYRKLQVPCTYPTEEEPDEQWMEHLKNLLRKAGLPVEAK